MKEHNIELDYVYITVIPTLLEDGSWEALVWSNNDGWVGVGSRETTVFSFDEVLFHGFAGMAPQNGIFDVWATPVTEVEKILDEVTKAHLAKLN